MKLRPFYLPAILAFCACLSSTAVGALVVSSEDFETGGTTAAAAAPSFGFSLDVENWGESSAGGFTDFVSEPGPAGFSVGSVGGVPALDGFLAATSAAGYLYREIGTQEGFESIEISGEVYRRDDAAQFSDLNVQLFSLSATDPFAFAESGNDVATTGNLVGEFVGLAPAAAGDGPVAFDFSYDVSSLADGDRLFVRLQSEGNGTTGLAYVDNLAFSATSVAIPEPSSLLAMCLVGVTAVTRRKR
jgi:hypothetical protein